MSGPAMDRPALDWPALMRLGLRDLRLRPRDFWALTPVELMIMAGLDAAPGPLTRARLEELAARYPDSKERSHQ